MKIGNSVILNNTEKKICLFVARSRTKNNVDSGIKNPRVGPREHDDEELEGFMAEFAFCKMFNLMPDFHIEFTSTSNGSDKGDAILKDGRSVDVKSTYREHGRILSRTWKKDNHGIDLYALMIGKNGTYTLKGFIKHEDLFKPENLINLGYGNSYGVTQDKLNELDEL